MYLEIKASSATLQLVIVSVIHLKTAKNGHQQLIVPHKSKIQYTLTFHAHRNSKAVTL